MLEESSPTTMPGPDAPEANSSTVATPSREGDNCLVASGRDELTEVLRDGAQRLMAQGIDAEVTDWIERHVEDRYKPW